MLIAVAVGAVVLLGLVALTVALVSRRKSSRRLRREFGPEYERTAANRPDARSAEHELRERRKRVEAYALRTLEPEEARRFVERWRAVQAEFLDRPGEAVDDADRLVVEVMEARGYESTTPRERVEDISVGHGDEAEEYRLARASAIRNKDGIASTEELRQAMLHFERVFSAVLVARTPLTA
jgi:hypothetical protein